MAQWTYYAHQRTDGQPIAELPLGDVSIEDVLSGTSTLQATMPLYEPMAARAYCAPWLREITAVRDGVIAFHGPIVGRAPAVGGKTVKISAASPHAYFYKRFTEQPRSFKREQFSLVRQLMTDAMAKTNGALYRISLGSGSSGVTKALTVGGTERQRVSELIETLSKDANSDFDFRWDYTWSDPVQHLVQRTFTLGNTIGRDLSTQRVIEVNADFVDLSDTEDGMIVANRVHVLGAGTGTKKLRAVSNSGASINAGYPLLEEAFDHSDVKSQTALNGIAAFLRNSLVPGTRNYESTHAISAHLPYGAIDLGDKVGLKVNAGVEQLNTTRRVVTVRTDPQTDRVTFVYYDPTDAS